MTPVDFKESNCTFGPPPGYDESQVGPLSAFDGKIERGSMEGSRVIVTAWLPSVKEMEAILNGSPIFISFIGGLPPHFPSTSFAEASCHV